jgi:hypothetical protein
MPVDIQEVKVSREIESEAIQWVVNQIQTALQDRQEMEIRWEDWIKNYEEILPKEKNFPWQNCSNINIPLTPIAVETIHAREVNTVYSYRPWMQVKSKKKNVPPENPDKLMRFLDHILAETLDFYKVGSQWMLEKNKMGTSFLKVYWNYDKRKTGKGKDFKVTDDAAISVVSIEDLIFPVNAVDIQTCSFVAHRIRAGWYDLLRKQKLGVYKNTDKIKAFYETTTSEPSTGKNLQKAKEDAIKLQRTSPSELKEYKYFEVYFDWDVDDDGYGEPTIMTIHMDSRTPMRWIYQPFSHGKRPFIRNGYQDRVGSIYAKGICEQSEYIQAGINTTVNQAIDNMTIANAKCFKGRKNARKDIGKPFPGKIFWLDDPTDLMEFNFGEVHESSFLLHNILKDYHERRTKVTDYTLGKESSIMKSRATATSTLALLQESGRHFDLVINNTRQAMVELAYMVIELYSQYRPEKAFLVDGGDGKSEILTLPEGFVREEYEFYCTATSLAVNKEIAKQTNLLLMQQLSGVFQQMIQLLMVVFNPQIQIPPEIKQFIFGVLKSYYTMAEDLVRGFEKSDVEQYLPELPEIVKMAYGQIQPRGPSVEEIIQEVMGGGGQGQVTALAGTNPSAGMGLALPGGGGTEGQGYGGNAPPIAGR